MHRIGSGRRSRILVSFRKKKEKRASLAARDGVALFIKAQKKLVFLTQENGGVLLRDQKYQKSKRGKNSSFKLFLCRLAATRANILPRQSDYRLNRKRSSNPRLTRDLVCADFGFSRPNSMSIKPCLHSRSLAYSGKRIKSRGGSHPPRRICSLFAAYCVRTRGMADDVMRDVLELF